MRYDLLENRKRIYISPTTIILLNVFLPVIHTFFPTDKGIVFSLIFAELLLLVMGYYKKVIKTVLFLVLFFGIYLASVFVFQMDLFSTMLKMTILFLPSYVLVTVLISAYHTSEILSGLQKLRLPKIFIIGLTVTIRYIPTFVEEFKLIKASMQIRGMEFSIFHPIRTFEFLIVPQLFRCVSLSQELTSAALTKGMEAPMRRTSYFDRAFSICDFLAVTFLSAGHVLIVAGVV